MKGPVARLLIVILNIPYWLSTVVGLVIPIVAVWVAIESSSDYLLIYSGWFIGLYAAWFAAYWSIVLFVRLLQFILLGHTKPADLLIEAKMDSDEFKELLTREGYTRASARAEVAATLTERSRGMGKAGWIFLAICFAIGFVVVSFVAA